MRKLRITVGNKSYDVTVEDLTGMDAYPEQPKPQAVSPIESVAAPAAISQPGSGARSPVPVAAGAVTSPMAGAIRSVLIKPGDTVKQGQPLVILEAMKMENQITAPVAGNVHRIEVAEGDSVTEGQVLLVLE